MSEVGAASGGVADPRSNCTQFTAGISAIRQADILWAVHSGKVAGWEMNGTAAICGATLVSLARPATLELAIA
jgi:hypothetical protein